TGAVHELYLGTHKVKDGDFAHRIQVRGADQLAELGVSFNRMTENLGRLLAVEKEKERLQAEISIAREVQSRLFPRAVPRLETLQIAGACQPARSVSGDYYDILAVEESSLCLALGDVAGKGISAALLMASIQSIMRTQLSLGQPKRAFAGAPSGSWNGMGRISTAEMVSQLNRQLYASTSPEKYATFFFGLYEEASGLLTYTNAGHPPPVLLRRGEPERLEVTGTVVGAFPRAGYDERSLTLAPGDLLVAFTDGVTEAENEYGRMFGEERLIELLARHGSEELQGLIRRVMESVAGWAGAAEPQDDMTLLAARRI
ncbi:MAG: PP2C family protein-serine/threonine phosphatase, partial [Acidobacteria bacterium]|nr:PP2C family protein-serine/threonine phosphatase [Acidobacteriota bacterium]